MFDAAHRASAAALVIISDGADTASDASLRDLHSALSRSDVFVYADRDRLAGVANRSTRA